MRGLAALAFALALPACASSAAPPDPRFVPILTGYTWYRGDTPPAAFVFWRVIPFDTLQSKCEASKGSLVWACAFHYGAICTIYAPWPEEEAPVDLRIHERRHCAGELHREVDAPLVLQRPVTPQ